MQNRLRSFRQAAATLLVLAAAACALPPIGIPAPGYEVKGFNMAGDQLVCAVQTYPNGQTEKFALLERAKPASALVVAQGAGIFQVRKTDDSGLAPAGVSGRVARNGAFTTIGEAGSPAQVRGLRAGVVSEAAQLSNLCDRAIGATQADMTTQMNIAGFNLAVRSRADVGAWVYDFMSGRRLDPGIAPAPGSLGVSVAPSPQSVNGYGASDG